MTDDVLQGLTEPQTTTTEEPSSYVETLVGEGKKYANVELLAKSRADADRHIQTLETEHKGMKEYIEQLEAKVSEATTLDSVLQKLNQQPNGQGADNQDALKPEDVQSLVNEALKQERTKEQSTTNRRQVNEALLQAHQGDKNAAVLAINDRLKEVGLTPSKFTELSETSPQAALRILNLTQIKTNKPDSPSGLADFTTAPTNTSSVRDHKYYREMRKELGNSKFFGDIRLQAQMQQDKIKLGNKYFSG